jgi:hypothetical protein
MVPMFYFIFYKMNGLRNKVDDEIWLERNAPDFYSGCAPFEFLPGLSGLRLFCSFPQSLQANASR